MRRRGSQKSPIWSNRAVVGSALVLAGAAAIKVVLILVDAFPFNSDEAIVGLMARHILQGRWPTFFYGQAYMGSLDATLVAVAFRWFDQGVVVIRAVQILLYLGTVLTTMLLTVRICAARKAAIFAGLLMALPTVNLTLYTTVSLGGYGEMLLIGNLLLLLALGPEERIHNPWYTFCWGLLSGLGFWAFGLTLVYIIPTGVYLFTRRRSEAGAGSLLSLILPAFLGFSLGASPWIAWGLSHGPAALVQELFGSAIAGASTGSALRDLGLRAVNLLLFGSTVTFGFRPPWEVRWLALPLLPFAFTVWGLVFVIGARFFRKSHPDHRALRLIAAVPGVLILGFVLTPFGADPSGRYFLPISVSLALLAAVVLGSDRLPERWSYLMLGTLLATHLWGTVESAARRPPGITTQFDPVSWIDHAYDPELMTFLRVNGELRGYTNYWVSYPLAFQSSEDLIFIPRLPYHEDFRYTARDDRYSTYDEIVEDSGRAAYITTNHQALDDFLREAFREGGISWKERWIGDYHIYYDLSAPIRPRDMRAPWLDDPSPH